MVKQGHTELGPFYYKRPLPEGEGTESAVLWPFFQSYSGPGVRQLAFRPLLNWRNAETGGLNGDVFEVQALWPLFLYRRTEGVNRLRTRVYPFFFHRRFHRPEGDEEVDTALLPFLLTGNSEKLGSYFALFPFGGVLKGFFAQDKIRFFLFPLYAEVWKGEYHSRHILWPIFRYGKGGGRSTLRIFPFYGYKEKENWWKKVFVFWPFFARSQEWLGTERPTDSWFFLPFYARQQTPFGQISYYLYPFFSYQRNERPGNRYRAWTLPWPLIQGMRGDRYWKTYFWPLWGRYRVSDHYEKEIAAYPIYWFSSSSATDSRTTRRYLLPFYWDTHKTDLSGDELQTRLKVWPLLEIDREPRGQSHLSLLSPLWFRDPAGMERNYADFWTLYRQERSRDGHGIYRLLWYRWAGDAPPAAGSEPPPGSALEEPGARQRTGVPEDTLRPLPGVDAGPGHGRAGRGEPPTSPGEEIINEIPWAEKVLEPLREEKE